jgi:Tetracyclin repressor-like, C-terminal domain
MSLYACFASKGELLDLMYFDVAGRMFANVESGDWRAALRSVGRSIREILGEHPSWAELLSRPAPPLVSPAREHLLEKLRSAGMTAEQAFTALSSVVLGSLGLMLVEFALRAAPGQVGLEERLESLKASVAANPDQVVTRQALRRLEQFKLGSIHEQSLEMLLRGFASWTRDGDA